MLIPAALTAYLLFPVTGWAAFDGLPLGLVLGCLAWALVTASWAPARARWIAIGWVIAVADAVRFAWPAASRVVLQYGGDDPLTYETQARDARGLR